MDETMETQNASVAKPSSALNAEKIFWGLVIALIAGFFLFFAFGGLVAPVSAAVQQGGNVAQPSGGGLFAAQPSPAPTGGELATVKNGVQEITLTVQGSSYMPNPIRVKKGIPVRITADLSSVRGCASSIIMPEFNVRKSFRQGDNSVEFTPDKSGTFTFSCSMGMYRGTIVVEESDGTVANFKGAAPAELPAGGSCGAGGGGCGCGG
ncbi:MAG: cupredoxin domain-containing protein [Candidatus Anstonellaceae archaeon]